MDEVLATVSSPDLLARAERNMIGFWSAYGRGPGSSFCERPELVWFETGVPTPLFNGVLRAQLAAEAVAPAIEEVRSALARRAMAGFWWIGPATQPANLGSALEHHGLQAVGEVTGMSCDLTRMPMGGELPAGFTIERVDSAQERELWARIAGTGTGFPEPATEALAQLEAQLTDPGYAAQRRYIGFLDGKPVATSALVLEAGVAGVYAVATFPEVRARGIGTIMTRIPLQEARDLGYRVATLQASGMGHPIYRKLGFRDTGKYRLYLHSCGASS